MDETKAATWAVGQLRHLYKQMVAGGVRDTAEAARGLLGPAIERLEPLTTPAPSQPTPDTESLKAALRKVEAERDEARAANDSITEAADKLAARIVELEAINNMELTETGALALASPSESAPQPTPETRVDLEALEKLLAKGAAGPWVATGSGYVCNLRPDGCINYFLQRGYEGEMLPADAALVVALRNAAPSLIAELRARRAIPTGQQQEAGALELAAAKKENSNLRKWLQWMQEGMSFHAANVELHALAVLAAFGMIPDARSTAVVSLTGTQGAALDELRDALRGEPMDEEYKGRVAEFKRAAAPPSAPQEGLFKEGWEAGREAAARLVDEVESELSLLSMRFVTVKVVSARIRALPLPESALTKAAPPTQPAVPEKEQAHVAEFVGMARSEVLAGPGEPGPESRALTGPSGLVDASRDRLSDQVRGADGRALPAEAEVAVDVTLKEGVAPAPPPGWVTCDHCPDYPHPLNDDGTICKRPCPAAPAPVETRLTGLTEEES